MAGLLFERGIEVTVIPHLYDLAPEGTGMLCLQSVPGDMIVLSWLYPRTAHWTLDRNGIRGRVGKTLLESEAEEDEDEDDAHDEEAEKPRVVDDRAAPNRTIYCIDLRARNEVAPFVEEVRRIISEASVQTVGVDLLGWNPRFAKARPVEPVSESRPLQRRRRVHRPSRKRRLPSPSCSRP